ncbi:hypothetical protein TIFTF001_051073, partial [Ficus carica]
MFPAGDPPRLAGITPPAAGSVPGGRSAKDGVNDVLGLRFLCSVDRPRILSGGRCWAAALTILGVVTYILVEMVIFVRVPPGTIRTDRGRVPEEATVGHLVEDMLYVGDQRRVLGELTLRCSRAAVGLHLSSSRRVLPLVPSVLVGTPRLPPFRLP